MNEIEEKDIILYKLGLSLKNIAKKLGYKSPNSIKNSRSCYSLRIHSRRMFDDLNKQGVIFNKQSMNLWIIF